MVKLVALAILAMVAFAANSLLARLALGTGETGALGYTGLRLVAGAITLALILRARRDRRRAAIGGSWAGAAALFGYALTFSVAYVVLGAATGALILFASVQVGMLTFAIGRGDRPGPAEWLGFGVAFAAFVLLVAPGLAAPPLEGTGLMVAAGLCWAAYSLLGRGSRAPLADTEGNFIRCLPAALLVLVAGGMPGVSGTGAIYAIASGALASGVGYAIWYAALPRLSRIGAATLQLTVPAIAALGAVLFLGEELTTRLLLCSAAILGGIALALLAGERRKASAT